MIGILAGMGQKDSCSGMYKTGIAGISAPRAEFLPFVRPMMLRIMVGMRQKSYMSTSLSCRKDSSPWYRLVGRPLRIRFCSTR